MNILSESNLNYTRNHTEIHDPTYIGLFSITSLWIGLLVSLLNSKVKCLENFLPYTVNLLFLGTILGFIYKTKLIRF